MEKNILVIDGKGGKMGSRIVELLRARLPQGRIIAVGTNSIATSAMLKSGATDGATGENAVIVCSSDADIIVGPIGIVMADALLGEITAPMAAAVARSRAEKVLIPSSKCSTHIAGSFGKPLGELTADAANIVLSLCKTGRSEDRAE